MNTFQQNLYANLMALVASNEAFYFQDFDLDGKTYRIFNYRLASYTDFLQPGALECRGIMFEVVGETAVRLASHPMSKFFNLNENPLTIGLDLSTVVEIQEKADGCFPLKGHLDLWDGGTIEIGKVVKQKMSPTLVGMDKEGNIVPCQITGWKSNGAKQNWLEITYDRKQRGRTTYSLRLTGNHHVFVNGQYKSADAIKIGDTLTRAEKQPCKNTLHLIRSSLLGDGSITKNGSSFRFQEGHADSQLEYVKFIHKKLGACAARTLYTQPPRSDRFSNTQITFANTRSYDCLSELRMNWYEGKVKRIPADISWIDAFTVAKWYCDDGSIRHQTNDDGACTFSTNSFSENDVKRLADKLSEMFGVRCNVHHNKGWSIRVNNTDGQISTMWNAIVPHIPMCMRYKVPKQYASLPFVDWPIGVEQLVSVPTTVKSIKQLDHTDRKVFHSGTVGYDIETTTHNYFCGGVLVHNSLMSTYLHNGQLRLKSKGSLFSEQAIAAMKWLDAHPTFKQKLALVTIDLTVNLEWCSPEHRIVLGYMEPSLKILNARNHSTGEYNNDIRTFFRTEMVESVKVDDPAAFVASIPAMTDVEGYVIRLASGQRVKIKCDWYLSLHHAKDSVNNPRRLFEAILDEGIDDLRSLFHTDPLAMRTIDQMQVKVDHVYNSMVKIVEGFHEANKHLDRKEYAIKGQQDPSLTDGKVSYFGLVMNKYLGKSVNYKEFLKGKWKELGLKDTSLEKTEV